MGTAPASLVSEKTVHAGHRDQIAAYFRAHPAEVVRWETLEALVGRNYQQRISQARLQLKMDIENIPRYAADGKRLTGDYRWRKHALGRDAATLGHATPQVLPIFGDQPGAFQR